MSAYIDRVIQQSLRWVNSVSVHNHVDDECVLDFSCCHPELFNGDRVEREVAHGKLIERLRGRGQQ